VEKFSMAGRPHPAYSPRNQRSIGTFLLVIAAVAAIAVIAPGYWLIAALACYAAAVFVWWPLVNEWYGVPNWKALKSEFWIASLTGTLLILFGIILMFWHPNAATPSIAGNGNVVGNSVNITGNNNTTIYGSDRSSDNPNSIFHLTPEQRRKFAAAAIAPPNGPHQFSILINGMCQDCQVFSDAIREILNEIPGWSVGAGNRFMPYPIVKGIEIVVENRNRQTPAAVAIEQALQRADIPFHIKEDPGGSPQSAYVDVSKMEFQVILGPQ
jgi:hypothetical protein